MEEHDEEMARMCQREENEEAIVQSVLQQSLVQASGVPQTAQEEKDHLNQATALSLIQGKTKQNINGQCSTCLSVIKWVSCFDTH